jgi:hypothetical protein
VKRNNLIEQPILAPPPPVPLSSSSSALSQQQSVSPSKFNKTKTLAIGSTINFQNCDVKQSNPMSNSGSLVNINNQTYITQNSPVKSDQYKPFVRTNFSNENSFSSSTLGSPSCQVPLASSTILHANNANQFDIRRKLDEKFAKSNKLI